MKLVRVASLSSSLGTEFGVLEILIVSLFVPSVARVTICFVSFIFLEGSKVVS